MEYRLDFSTATKLWNKFVASEGYRSLQRLGQQALKIDAEGEQYVDSTVINGPLFRRSVQKYLLGFENEGDFTNSRGIINDPHGFLLHYLTTPYAAFAVLSGCREMIYSYQEKSTSQKREYAPDQLVPVAVPDYILDKLLTPYKFKPHRAFEHYINLILLLSIDMLMRWHNTLRSTFRTLENKITLARKKQSKHELAYWLYNYSSLKKMSNLQCSIPLAHNAAERPNAYIEDATSALFRAEVEPCASFFAKVFKPKIGPAILEHQSTTPLDSSIGNALYHPRQTLEERVRCMVLLGFIGDKFKTMAQRDYFLKKMASVWHEFGYDDLTTTRVAGIRYMHKGDKPEYVAPAGADVRSQQFADYTIGVQNRLRLIFADGQWDKAEYKRVFDSYKNVWFKLSKTASTDSDFTTAKVRQIGKYAYQHDLFIENDKGEPVCLCATDAVGWDRTLAFSAETANDVLIKKLFPTYPEAEHVKEVTSPITLIPGNLDGTNGVFGIRLGTSMMASGEPGVTAKNNGSHHFYYYIGLHCVTGLSYEAIHKKFTTGEWILCVHGDDLLRYLGPDKDLYLKLDKWFKEHIGVINEYEYMPVFLKKYLTPKGQMGIDFGGFIRNFLGEYAKNYRIVVEMGLFAKRLNLEDDSANEIVDPVVRVLHQILGTSYVSKENVKAQYDQILNRMTRIADTLGKKASNFRRVLDGYYYTNGESFADARMETIYGSVRVDYANSEYARAFVGKTFEQLVDQACDIQREYLKRSKPVIVKQFRSAYRPRNSARA